MKVTSADLLFKSKIEQSFPNLTQSDYSITSPYDKAYNCIAWVAGDSTRWWWPDQFSYWPPTAPLQATVFAFQKAFESLGYEKCECSEFEIGFVKIAFYVDDSGKPTHGARQNETGTWLSKLGSWPDIIHATLDGLYSSIYGPRVGLIMKRPLRMHEV